MPKYNNIEDNDEDSFEDNNATTTPPPPPPPAAAAAESSKKKGGIWNQVKKYLKKFLYSTGCIFQEYIILLILIGCLVFQPVAYIIPKTPLIGSLIPNRSMPEGYHYTYKSFFEKASTLIILYLFIKYIMKLQLLKKN